MGIELLHIPFGWFLAITTGCGLIIGSFLNVLLYRFHTGKSLNGRSHCLSCGIILQARDLVPLVSYLALRGRCRSCGSYIPVRYFVVEVSTAVLFFLSALTATSVAQFALLLSVSVLAVLIVVYDIRHFIIPDEFTAALTVVAGVNLAYISWQARGLETALWTIGAALCGVFFFYALWFISKGRWIGFGDVKLIFPLGLLVGPMLVFSLIVYAFWIGAGVSILLVLLAKLQGGKLRLHLPIRNITIKSVVPFAPFLIAACLLTLFTQYNVLNLFSFISR